MEHNWNWTEVFHWDIYSVELTVEKAATTAAKAITVAATATATIATVNMNTKHSTPTTQDTTLGTFNVCIHVFCTGSLCSRMDRKHCVFEYAIHSICFHWATIFWTAPCVISLIHFNGWKHTSFLSHKLQRCFSTFLHSFSEAVWKIMHNDTRNIMSLKKRWGKLVMRVLFNKYEKEPGNANLLHFEVFTTILLYFTFCETIYINEHENDDNKN